MEERIEECRWANFLFLFDISPIISAQCQLTKEQGRGSGYSMRDG